MFLHSSRLSIVFGISFILQRVSPTNWSMYVFRGLPLPPVPWLGCQSITSATISSFTRQHCWSNCWSNSGRLTVVFNVVVLYLTSEYFHTDPLLSDDLSTTCSRLLSAFWYNLHLNFFFKFCQCPSCCSVY